MNYLLIELQVSLPLLLKSCLFKDILTGLYKKVKYLNHRKLKNTFIDSKRSDIKHVLLKKMFKTFTKAWGKK